MAIPPIIRGLYLCEMATADLATKNLTLQNCFRILKVAFLPSKARAFYAVAYLANGLGDFQFTIQVKRLDTLEVVYMTRGPLSFLDRLEEVRLKVRIEQCVFPISGEIGRAHV